MSSLPDNSENLAPPASPIVGDGEMARLIRSFAWETTSLGPLRAWPESLIQSVNLILFTKFPAAVFWGPRMIVFYNDAFFPLLGERHPSGLGKLAQDVWAEAWHLVSGKLEKALQGEATFEENVLVPVQRSKQVEDVYWTYSYSPIFTTGGKVGGVLVVCHDTTEEVRGAARLRRNEEKFRTFVEAVSDVVYRMSADWSVALQVEGRGFLPDTHAPDRDWFQRNVHPDDQPRVLAAIHKAIREGSVFEMEHKVQRLDGTLGWTFSRAIPVRDQHGTIVEWFGAASDITARKQAEQALLSAEKLAVVGRLASSIAHEINNPLEAVTNLLYLAEQTADPETKSMLCTAQQELQRVSLIAANTLRFNRQKLHPAPIDIGDTMQSVLNLYEGRFRQAGIQVTFRKEACPLITALGGEIRQVFANLVGNAVDAMSRGGNLKIRVRPGTNWRTGTQGIRITFADNGHGMSSKTKAQVYKPFFTTKENTGTGLGLWISADIVHRHRGVIRLRSSETGTFAGTTFSLFLPYDES